MQKTSFQIPGFSNVIFQPGVKIVSRWATRQSRLGPVTWSRLPGSKQSDFFQTIGPWGVRGFRGEGPQETEERLVTQAGGLRVRLLPHQLSFTPSLKVALQGSFHGRQGTGLLRDIHFLPAGAFTSALAFPHGKV